MIRIGHGFDVHAFGGIGPIFIGGICIPYEKGILSHSDGDVVLHALIDSLFGAAALGDIGKFFPDTNPDLKGISSQKLLGKTWKYIQKKGYTVNNIDVTIIVQFPQIQSYITQMRTLISRSLNCHINSINIKATTTEKLGFIGRSEGIACEAVSLLTKNQTVSNLFS